MPAMARNTRTKTTCAVTIRLLIPDTELMPRMFSTVTRVMEPTTKTQAGTSGKAILRNRPITR
ncbi:hypothetical protein D3C81_2208170 [compost metagenome]